MPLKARSVTTSSRSSTSSGSGSGKPPEYPGDTPVQFVKGVGPRLGAIFESRDIHTVKDLLTFFPRAYEDRTQLLKVAELAEGQTSTVAVQVMDSRKIPIKGGMRTMLEVRTRDETGILGLKWFHAPRGMAERFKPGMQIIVTGAVKKFMGRAEIVHPEITWGASAAPIGPSPAAGRPGSGSLGLGARPGSAPAAGAPGGGDEAGRDYGRVVPIYTEIEGVPSRALRKILWEAIEKFAHTLSEDLPEKHLKAHGLPRLADAIKAIHFPEEDDPKLLEFATPAHHRLIYEEFFKFEYLILRRKAGMAREAAVSVDLERARKTVADLAAGLPFQLTGDQRRAIDEIVVDVSQPHPMNRLIQGDVGSGKTAVAFLSSAVFMAEGGQVALMAPTEILAEQHFKNAVRLFGGRLKVALLTGKTPQSERGPLLQRLAAGEPVLLIGTHALLEDPVVFKNLVYVLIDEQHRFGVEQRRTLRAKGTRPDPATGKQIRAHQLVLTATPIPRTLALTAYGDLTVSSIKEMPPGRSPIVTQVIRGEARLLAYERIRDELRKGHQAYFIYPLVNDSEAEGFTSLKSAVTETDHLRHEVFPEFKVGLLHGQMKPEEKSQVMEAFKRNELQILVSTTVVEVGVDVPNATVIAVEHAERFGLSQLHQLRGRVGRGQAQSHCFFFANKRQAEATSMRLEVLEETNDGFKIAEADLEIRGPGEFLGTRQAGSLPFRMAHLVRDRDWLLKAREDAQALLSQDPDLSLPEHSCLKKYFQREGRIQFDRLKTS